MERIIAHNIRIGVVNSDSEFWTIFISFAAFFIVVLSIAPDILPLHPVISDLLFHKTNIIFENNFSSCRHDLDYNRLELVRNIENDCFVPDRPGTYPDFRLRHGMVLIYLDLRGRVLIQIDSINNMYLQFRIVANTHCVESLCPFRFLEFDRDFSFLTCVVNNLLHALNLAFLKFLSRLNILHYEFIPKEPNPVSSAQGSLCC